MLRIFRSNSIKAEQQDAQQIRKLRTLFGVQCREQSILVSQVKGRDLLEESLTLLGQAHKYSTLIMRVCDALYDTLTFEAVDTHADRATRQLQCIHQCALRKLIKVCLRDAG